VVVVAAAAFFAAVAAHPRGAFLKRRPLSLAFTATLR